MSSENCFDEWLAFDSIRHQGRSARSEKRSRSALRGPSKFFLSDEERRSHTRKEGFILEIPSMNGRMCQEQEIAFLPRDPESRHVESGWGSSREFLELCFCVVFLSFSLLPFY